MHQDTGELAYLNDIPEETINKFHPIPDDTKIDTICKLQNKDMKPADRLKILKAIQKRERRANKHKHMSSPSPVTGLGLRT